MMNYFVYNSEDGLVLQDSLEIARDQAKLDIEYFMSINEEDIAKSVCVGTVGYIVDDEFKLVCNS